MGLPRRFTPRNDIIDRRDACPTVGLGIASVALLPRNDGGMDSRFRGNDRRGGGNDRRGGGNDIRGKYGIAASFHSSQ